MGFRRADAGKLFLRLAPCLTVQPEASANNGGFLQSYVYKVEPSLKDLSASDQNMWDDTIGRTFFTGVLIRDERKGMLDGMVESTYGEQAGQHPEFGEEIMEIARSL